MTYKALVDAAITGAKADRAPFLILDGGTWVVSQLGGSFADLLAREDAGASEICRLFNEAGAAWHNAMAGFGIAWLKALGCKADLNKTGGSLDVHPAITDAVTEIPKLDKSTIRATIEKDPMIARLLLQAKGIKAIAEKEGKYVCYSVLGPFSTAGVMLGTEELVGTLYDDPDLVHTLLDYTTEVCYQIIDLLHGVGCDIPIVCEPTAGGEMISPSCYEEFAEPYLKTLQERTAGKYVYFTAHMCGNSAARVAPLTAMGVRAFSVDWKVDVAQAVKDADGKMCLWGNINPAGTVFGGTPEQAYAESVAAIKAAGGKPFALMPGCDLPYGAPMANLKAMAKAAAETAIG